MKFVLAELNHRVSLTPIMSLDYKEAFECLWKETILFREMYLAERYSDIMELADVTIAKMRDIQNCRKSCH